MVWFVFFQAEDGIRDLVRSRGLGDVYKRQGHDGAKLSKRHGALGVDAYRDEMGVLPEALFNYLCLLYTSDAADERSSVDLGGRRIIKKTKTTLTRTQLILNTQ